MFATFHSKKTFAYIYLTSFFRKFRSDLNIKSLFYSLFEHEGKRSHIDGATAKPTRTNTSSARANEGYSSRPIFSILFPISVYCAKCFFLDRFHFLSLHSIRERNFIEAK
jgi:hypothetical protein